VMLFKELFIFSIFITKDCRQAGCEQVRCGHEHKLNVGKSDDLQAVWRDLCAFGLMMMMNGHNAGIKTSLADYLARLYFPCCEPFCLCISSAKLDNNANVHCLSTEKVINGVKSAAAAFQLCVGDQLFVWSVGCS
jgi:hypothetical protein